MRYEIDIITALPEYWAGLGRRSAGLVGRAVEDGRVLLKVVDLREYGRGPQRQIDDAPYGGGAGMVLRPEPMVEAIEAAQARRPRPVLIMSPVGKEWSQGEADALARGEGMILLCPRYEGYDQRVMDWVDHSVCVGHSVLSGGDPAAALVFDSVVRLLPGVLGNPASLDGESFREGRLSAPHYTRPADFRGRQVPAVLQSGNHREIEKWRQAESKPVGASKGSPSTQPQISTD